MVSTRLLSSAQRRLLVSQWLQEGQCLRCLHTTRTTAKENQPIDRAKNTDEHSSSRRQRGARTTDELTSIARKDAAQNKPQPKVIQEKFVERAGKNANHESQSTTSRRRRTSKPSLDATALLRSGQGTSTIANSNYRGVLVDRIHLVAARQSSPAAYFGNSESRKRRASSKHIPTAFTNRAEKLEFENGLEERATISRPGDAVEQNFLRKAVVGAHEGGDVLGGREKYKQETLNMVARAMTLNSSYMATDAARFVDKVNSLLPAAPSARTKRAST